MEWDCARTDAKLCEEFNTRVLLNIYFRSSLSSSLPMADFMTNSHFVSRQQKFNEISDQILYIAIVCSFSQKVPFLRNEPCSLKKLNTNENYASIIRNKFIIRIAFIIILFFSFTLFILNSLYIAALMLNCFCLTKSFVSFLQPKIIFASFLHLSVILQSDNQSYFKTAVCGNSLLQLL